MRAIRIYSKCNAKRIPCENLYQSFNQYNWQIEQAEQASKVIY